MVPAAITTDLADYPFGATAHITGSGFQPGETVQLQVRHAEQSLGSNDHPQNQPWQVTDGGQGDLDGMADGNLRTSWMVTDPDAPGASYILTGAGLTSGAVATAAFTDSAVTSFSMFDLTPDYALPGAQKVAILGFQILSDGANNKFSRVELRYAGTNAFDDIAQAHLYYRVFDAPPTTQAFDLAASTRLDLLSGEEKDQPKPGSSLMILQGTSDLYLAADKWYQFYIVVDVKITAPLGNQIDFEIYDKEKIEFDNGKFPKEGEPLGADGFTIVGSGANAAPVAHPDDYIVNEDTTLSVSAPGLLGNDTDADGDVLTAILVSGPTHGTLTWNANGSFTYTPNLNFHGTDSFTYLANDGQANSNVATVTITVNAVNDAPEASNISASADEAGPALSATASFTDVDAADTHTFTSDATGTRGVVINHGDGTFSYDPDGQFEHLAAGETATDAFTYTVDDGKGGTSTATVTITILGRNDAPMVVHLLGDADEDGPALTVKASFTDVDTADTHTVTTNTTGTLGVVINHGDGTFSYDTDGQFEHLAAGETATDAFTYTVDDGKGGTTTATVTITIHGQDDAPPGPDVQSAAAPDEPAPPASSSEPAEMSAAPDTPVLSAIDPAPDNTVPAETPGGASGGNGENQPLVPAASEAPDRAQGWSVPPRNAEPPARAFDVWTAAAQIIDAVRDRLSTSSRPMNSFRAGLLWKELDALEKQLIEPSELRVGGVYFAVGTTIVLSAGYVVWNLRHASWIAGTFLGGLPFFGQYSQFDPLLVVEQWEEELGRGASDADEDSLETLVH